MKGEYRVHRNEGNRDSHIAVTLGSFDLFYFRDTTFCSIRLAALENGALSGTVPFEIRQRQQYPRRIARLVSR